MAFKNYKSISAVIKKFQIKYFQENLMLEVDFPVKNSFRQELDLLFKVFSGNARSTAIKFSRSQALFSFPGSAWECITRGSASYSRCITRGSAWERVWGGRASLNSFPAVVWERVKTS